MAKYLRAGASGSGNGSDWTNAYTTINGADAGLARGDGILYVAAGTYAGGTFDVGNSGSTVIEIRRATVADHGTSTGWNNAYDGQVTLSGDIILGSDYWTINGATVTTTNWNSRGFATSYLFKIPTVTASTAITPGFCASHVTLQKLDLGGPESSSYTGDEPTAAVYIGGFDELATDWTIQDCYLHNIAHAAQLHLNGLDGALIERCWISYGWGKEAIRGQIACKNAIIRYNTLFNASMNSGEPGEGSTAEIAIWDGSANQFDGNQIYGNVFFRDNAEENSGGTIVVGGNGSSWAGSPANNTLVYNNTIAGVTGSSVGAQILINGGTGNVVRNTLWYDVVGNPPNVTANTVSNNSESGSDIFVDYAAGDLRLASNTVAGFTLAAPYNEDMDGIVRGSGGQDWSLGAFQFTEDPPPSDVTVNATNLVVGTLTVG